MREISTIVIILHIQSLSKQYGPFCGISSGSSLFAKIPVFRFPVYKELIIFFYQVLDVCDKKKTFFSSFLVTRSVFQLKLNEMSHNSLTNVFCESG